MFLAHPSSAVLKPAQAGLVIFNISLYSQTCVQRPPLGPEKCGHLTEVSDKTEI